MTDPRIGQPEAGRTGANAGPAEATGRSRGPGSTAAPQAGSPAGAVPQQYEPQQYGEPYQEEPGTGSEGTAMRGDALLATAARQSWPAVLVGGVGLIALGVILLVWPHASLTVVAVLIGAALVVSGLVRLYEGFTASNQSGGMRAAYVVVGLLAILAGLYCLRHHALSLFLVAFVTGVYFIAHGISDIGIAASVPVPGRGLRAVLGVFSLAAGIIMVIWPAITVVLLLTIVAAWLLFYGLMLCGLAFSLHKAGRSAAARRSRSRQPMASSTA
jgi:uncharacterized membrane protein HdeD (DUF308 family)